jgi:hypothetical protein
MQARTLGIIGALVSAAAPLGAFAAETPADVKQLQEENRRLAEQLQSAQTELKKLKQTAPQSAAAPSSTREMSAPFAEETSAKESAPASAPTSIGTKDFTLAVGTKVWVNGWSTWRSLKFPNFDVIDKGINVQSLTAKSSDAVSPIPSLTARYKSFFLTGSYLAETDYRFSEQSHVYSVNLPAIGGAGYDALLLKYGMSGSRQEWDISLGYQILPYLAVTGGYKEIEQTFRIDSCSAQLLETGGGIAGDCTGLFPGKTRVTYAGPTIGLSGAAPIGHGFGLYGNFTYGWLGANFRSSTDSLVSDVDRVNNVDYYVGELGLTYSHLLRDMPVYMPLSAATAYAGYRYQSYESHLARSASNGNNPKDTVQGFVAGVNLAF